MKELRETPFSKNEEDDANEHIEKVLEFFEMFNLPSVSKDQIKLMLFSKTLIGAATRWIKSEPSGTITTWELLRSRFLAKYDPPSNFVRQIEEIYKFKQEVDKTLYRAWER
ncbi:hypothetical protein Tco_1404291 [Tanacetum coccineum]